MKEVKKSTVLTYDVVFEEADEGGYSVIVPALPGCVSEGDTFEESKQNIKEAITAYLESLAKDGQEPPQDNSTAFIAPIKVNRPTTVQHA